MFLNKSKMKLLLLIMCTLMCNSLTASQNARIVGGNQAVSGGFPYQISLQVQVSSLMTTIVRQTRWEHYCGGAIVSRRYVVTAAHCLDYPPTALSIWAGTTRLNGDGQRVMVDSYVIHPDYVQLESSNIAVVKAVRDFRYTSERIAPIHYTNELINGGEICILTGWGFKTPNQDRPVPNELQTISMRTITNDQCNNAEHRTDSTGMCTVSPNGSGACGGDTGGPLVRGNLLVGVVSYGTGMCGIGIPDVYTRVSVFAEWIREQTA